MGWRVVVCMAVIVLLSLSSTVRVESKLEDNDKDDAEEVLFEMLINKRFVSRIVFPAYKSGVNLRLDGTYDNQIVTRHIKDHGVGLGVDQPAVVTYVKLKGKHIEIHLNGGGYGTFGDVFSAAVSYSGFRGGGGVQAGGSRINLRFDRQIRIEDLDPKRMAEWLDPVVDASPLFYLSMLEELPLNVQQMAQRKEVEEGMSKEVVYAILGEPFDRKIDLSVNPPVERWLYEQRYLYVLIVTFSSGKVSHLQTI